MSAELADDLRTFAHELGLLVGLAPALPPKGLRAILAQRAALGWRAEFEPPEDERRWDPLAVLPSASSVVALAMPYGFGREHSGRPGPGSRRPRGRVSSYAVGEDYHRPLGWRTRALAAWLRAQGYASVAQTDTGPLAERAFAAAAGLGSVGRNGLLVVPGVGTRVFLALIVTAAPLGHDPLVPFDPCGSCDLCIRACPTDALGQLVPQRGGGADRGGLEHPISEAAPAAAGAVAGAWGAVDTTRCLSYATQVRGAVPDSARRALGLQVWGCDICQDVCPHEAGSREGARLSPLPALAGPPRNALPDLVALAGLGPGAFKRRWAHTAVNWRGRHVLARNALVALGNWGRTRAAAADPALRRKVWRILEEAARSPRPDRREHAIWAMAQWRRAPGQNAADRA